MWGFYPFAYQMKLDCVCVCVILKLSQKQKKTQLYLSSDMLLISLTAYKLILSAHLNRTNSSFVSTR